MLEKILNNEFSKILISIIWGLGLAVLFRRVCRGQKCIVVKATSSPSIIENKIFKYNKKCYKFKSESTDCN